MIHCGKQVYNKTFHEGSLKNKFGLWKVLEKSSVEKGFNFLYGPCNVYELSTTPSLSLQGFLVWDLPAFTVRSLCLVCMQISLFLLLDGEDASIRSAQEIIQPVAEHYFKMEEPPVQFFYTKGDDVSDSLREFGGLPDDDNLLVILDVPNQMSYVSEVEVLTREAVEKFVIDVDNGKLDGNKLKGWIATIF